MENKIYVTRLSLNAQKEIKDMFMEAYLVPLLNDIRETYLDMDLYVTRTIDGGPKFNLFYKGIDEDTAGKIDQELAACFNNFLSLNQNAIEEKDIYQREQKNIAKMNGLKRNFTYENYNHSFEIINRIVRKGEYRSIEEEETFNSWLFDHGSLQERTIDLLKQYSTLEKRKFILSLFLYISKQLNGMDLDGYMSFKSHYLGFMSMNKKMVPYHENIVREFKREQKEGHYKWLSFLDKGYTIKMDQIRYGLLEEWYEAIDDFVEAVDKLKKLEAPLWENVQMMKFRKLSDFHKEAFSPKNLAFYRSREFQAYRKIVNLMYLLLPTMGFNTIDRLYCAAGLTILVEREIYDGQVKV